MRGSWILGRKKGWDHLKRKLRLRRNGTVFSLRLDNLMRLGFRDYDNYLLSDLWKSIRYSVLARYPRCFVCGEAANQVHHKDYAMTTLQGLNAKKLFSLCGGCHFKIEFDGSRKRTLEEANLMLDALRKAR